MRVGECRYRGWGAWVGAALLFVTAVGVLQAEDWPEWRGPARSRRHGLPQDPNAPADA